MSKKCTRMWREAHFEANMLKTPPFRSTSVSSAKSARRCGAKHISKYKCYKNLRLGALWREAHFQVKILKTHHVRTILDIEPSVSAATRTGFWTLSGRRGTFEADLPRWISHGRRSTGDISIRHVRRSGRWFPQRVAVWIPLGTPTHRWHIQYLYQ